MKTASIRTIGFSDKVKGLTADQFRKKYSDRFSSAEIEHYIKSLGLVNRPVADKPSAPANTGKLEKPIADPRPDK